ncbi:DUF1924 domain-containing protein [Pararhodospirillum oryzae]|uniref:Cytochrome c domain-containing protein n=1 Tax=Pararhodospirillum oryzae TaxID=478448 RepID=A0A512H3M4_9PROT|nr:DUF1924 domain-containing protein [Pararhodospirillum oryzae]GEO80008.1 hypothetical protein ROR02_01390 [Pararhodospirillum oryzae]
MSALSLISRHPVATWRLWHAGLVGSGLVAYVTADEDTYALHQFSGYLFAVLAVGRLIVAAAPGIRGPWRLPQPGGKAAAPARLTRGAMFQRVRPLMTAVLIGVLLAAGLSGVGADWIHRLEKLHEAVGEATPWVVLAHVAVVVALLARLPQGLRRMATPQRALSALAAAGLLATLMGAAPPARAADPQQALLGVFTERAKAATPGFAGFDPKRGEALFLSRNTANPELPSCASCHTQDPRASGRHAKTGRAIDPMAPSVNRERFTDLAQVDKRLGRDCETVLGRACTPLEQGDFVAFMLSR